MVKSDTMITLSLCHNVVATSFLRDDNVTTTSYVGSETQKGPLEHMYLMAFIVLEIGNA